MAETVHIQTQRIAGAQSGPRLVIFGGVHGDEFEPMTAIRRLAKMLSPAQLRGTVTLAPVVNEPAFARGARVADDGLDLARAFPGRLDGSITERVACAASALIRAADFFIDLHTGGAVLDICPLAGYMLHSDPRVLDVQRRMARAIGLPIVWGTSPDLQGRSLSVARDANVPAIYCEYRGAATCREQGTAAYVDGCLNVMSALGMLARSLPDAPRPLVVEDSRPNSGHLQLGYPAPRDGFFSPVVQLGQRVAAGDRLGEVCDILGTSVETILARESGIVLLLRSYPRVNQGDALAAILETSLASGAHS